MIEPPCTERYARWCERSATQLMGSLLLDCFDPAIVAVVQTGNQLLLEMLRRLKLLQIQRFTLEKPKEILDHSIVRKISFTAHALPDAILPEHSPVLFVLVLPPLIL